MESIGRLAGGIAHDFNNLLTVILGYSRVLLAEHSSPEDPLHGFVKEISAAGERAASLTRQLLSFSRKQILVPRAMALDALALEMRPLLQRLVGEDIRVEVPPCDGPYMVRADPDQMSQIFMNLAANARDAMPQGGLLFIRVMEATPDQIPSAAPARLCAGPVVRLTVSDSGPGIDEETRQRMFEPFFTTKELGHGTGLGLATVYGIVEQSEGFIEVSSEPGRGAAFHIYLPRVGEVAEIAKAPVAVEEARGGSETILVVEDQDDLRRLVVTVLRARGYRVLDAADGRAALRAIADTLEPIDLLLTDVIMPDITGKQVADHARQSRPGIRVLFMSGYPGEVIARRGVLDRGVSYLPKPFSVEALTGKVREVLDTVER
jgi:CheY-like chemotaxis protein